MDESKNDLTLFDAMKGILAALAFDGIREIRISPEQMHLILERLRTDLSEECARLHLTDRATRWNPHSPTCSCSFLERPFARLHTEGIATWQDGLLSIHVTKDTAPAILFASPNIGTALGRLAEKFRGLWRLPIEQLRGVEL